MFKKLHFCVLLMAICHTVLASDPPADELINKVFSNDIEAKIDLAAVYEKQGNNEHAEKWRTLLTNQQADDDAQYEYVHWSGIKATFSPQSGDLHIDLYAAGGVGTELISEAIKHVDPASVTTLSCNVAETNLDTYNRILLQGHSSDAAKNTPLGKSLKRLG